MKTLTHSSLCGCTRKTPTQQRGEKRVAGLVGAAIAEFAAVGYEAATMCGIADRAGAPIGSLYQFFPNKQAIARAVRTRQIEDIEHLWVGLKPGSAERFADRFVDLMIEFVDGHPAFLPLLDSPSSTRPVGPRHRLRGRLELLLLELQPRLSRGAESRIAEIMFQINRAMMGLYAQSSHADRRWIIDEYRAILREFLARRLACGPPISKSPRGPARRKRAAASRIAGRARASVGAG